MALPNHFYLILFIVTISSAEYAYATLQRYIPLITEVHDRYASSSVILISSNVNQDTEEYMLFHRLSREFSRKAVPTLVINVNMLEERIRTWQNRVSRSVVVVMLTTPDELTDFIVSTREITMTNELWLLIFTDEYGHPMCEYCNKPMENIFRLRFDSKTMIVCCRDPLIKEWWAYRENKTEVTDFGEWTENGLKYFRTKRLYDRRHDVNGTGIRIAYNKGAAYPADSPKGEDGGFSYHVLMELQRAMNFNIATEIEENGSGAWNSTTKKWTGVISQIINDKADIGVGLFVITDLRLKAVDFSSPLAVTRTQLYIREPNGPRVQWSAYFEAFDRAVWMAIIVLTIAIPMLLSVMKTKARCESLSCLLFENSIQVWGIFCQQGLSKYPAETSLRIAYFSTFVSAWVVLSAYSASFISFLTVSTVSLPFSTVEGFTQDGSYKLIVLKNSADYELFTESTDPVWVKMTALLKPWSDLPETLEEGFEQVCRERVALHTNEILVKSSNVRLPCKIIRIDTGRISSMAIILSHQSQYTGVVDYHIQRFRDNGVLNRLKRTHLINRDPHTTMTTHNVVTVSGVTPIFLILAGGMILAFFLFLGEKFYRPCKNCMQKRHRANLKRMNIQKWFNVLEKHQMAQENLQRCVELRNHPLNSLHPRYHSQNIYIE